MTARFRSAHEAAVYAWHWWSLRDASECLPAHDGERDHDSLTFLEAVADGCMIRNRILRYAGLRGAIVLRAWYGSEAGAIVPLAGFLAGERGIPRPIAEHCAVSFAHMQPETDTRDIARQLGCSQSTVWRRARDATRDLADWRKAGLGMAEVGLEEGGLV